MNNYHYYLKQEILPPSTGASRFTSVAWHQENPRILYLTGKGWLVGKAYSHLPICLQRIVRLQTLRCKRHSNGRPPRPECRFQTTQAVLP